MLALNAKNNGVRILFPREFLHPLVEEKYTKVLKAKRSFFTRPIDFINETIRQVEVLGFNNAAVLQQQSSIPEAYEDIITGEQHDKNPFMHTFTDAAYRSAASPIDLIDKTLNIEFRHTLGFLNYIILFENFWYLYRRDTPYAGMPKQFKIELFDEVGVEFCNILIDDPIINGMDMLSFDYTSPVTSTSTFKMEFKYSNFDFEFPNRYFDDNAKMPYNDEGNTGVHDMNGHHVDVGPGGQIILDEC